MKKQILIIMAVLFYATLAAGAIVAPDTVDVGEQTTFQVVVQNPTNQPVNARIVLAGPLAYQVSPQVAPIGMFEEAVFTVTVPYPAARKHTTVAQTMYVELGDVTEQKTIDFVITERKSATDTPADANSDDAPTGFAGLGNVSLLDAGLVVVIIVLFVALVARVYHRVHGQ